MLLHLCVRFFRGVYIWQRAFFSAGSRPFSTNGYENVFSKKGPVGMGLLSRNCPWINTL